MKTENKCIATSEEAGVVGYSCCTDGESYESCSFNLPNGTGMCIKHGREGACLSIDAMNDFDDNEEALGSR